MKKIKYVLFLLLGLALLPKGVWGATITVSASSDTLTTGDGCTLREAIENANADTTTYMDCTPSDSYGDDTIVFDSSISTICLSDTTNGDLDISANLTITGDVTSGTTIDGGDTTAGGTTTCSSSLGERIFDVSSSVTATFKNLTIKNGKSSSGPGGGIAAGTSSTITVTNSTISGNTVNSSSSNSAGGGIYGAASSTINLTQSTISGNAVTSGSGYYAYGGGIFGAGSSDILLTNSTVSGNTVSSSDITAFGGGIFAWSTVTVTLNNSTLSGNRATSSTGNAYGGGIYGRLSTTTINLKNTILSGNNADGATEYGAECYSPGAVNSYGYNFIATASTSSNCTLTEVENSGTDITSQSADNLGLDDLADNGGNTQTMALSAGSPVIDAGSCTDKDGSTVASDQRGYTRTSPCDIGAYEVVCGDGSITGNESCDDGNATDADGCSASCETETLWYKDSDGDGYGDSSLSRYAVSQPSEEDGSVGVTHSEDCNDSDASIYPGATETCGDGIDSDCDSDPDTFELYTDSDGDGYGSSTGATSFNCDESTTQTGYASTDDDCNDASSSVNPGTTEACNSMDDNCDGATDEGCSESNPACGDGTVDSSEECDDGNTTDGDGCSADCIEEKSDETSVSRESNPSGGGGGCSLQNVYLRD